MHTYNIEIVQYPDTIMQYKGKESYTSRERQAHASKPKCGDIETPMHTKKIHIYVDTNIHCKYTDTKDRTQE
jgi:hypothetical protein